MTRQLIKAGVSVWNGEAFAGLIEDDGFRDSRGWNLAKKLRWYERYGAVPFNYRQTVTILSTNFQQLAQGKFLSLAAEVETIGFRGLINSSLCSAPNNTNGLLLNCTDEKSKLYLGDVINAGVRDRFFGNYNELNGLDAVLALTSEIQASIVGGNLRLIDRLVKLSGATVRLSVRVEVLSKAKDGGWNLTYTAGAQTASEQFDAVIIAAPLALSNIEIQPPLSSQIEDTLNISSHDTYVTHFTTSRRLNSSSLNVSDPAPQNILTTGRPYKENRSGCFPPFFQLRVIDRNVINPKTQRRENLYKLIKEHEPSDPEIAQYVEQNESLTEPTVTWIHREPLPRSVPRLERNQPIQEIEIAPGLFYAGGREQITASIELGCRMGTNAGLLALPARVGCETVSQRR